MSSAPAPSSASEMVSSSSSSSSSSSHSPHLMSSSTMGISAIESKSSHSPFVSRTSPASGNSPPSGSSEASMAVGGDADDHTQQETEETSHISSDSVSSTDTQAIAQPTHDEIGRAQEYCDSFIRLFVITDQGMIQGTRERLRHIQEWFNTQHPMISSMMDIDLGPISFCYELDSSGFAKNWNSVQLGQVYFACYTVLVKMARTIRQPVPERYQPFLPAQVE